MVERENCIKVNKLQKERFLIYDEGEKLCIQAFHPFSIIEETILRDFYIFCRIIRVIIPSATLRSKSI